VIVVPPLPQTAPPPKANDDPENTDTGATEFLSQLDTNMPPVATEARLASFPSAASTAAMLVGTRPAEGSVAAEATVVGEREGAAGAFEGEGVGKVPYSSASAVPDGETITVHVTTAEHFEKPVSPTRSFSLVFRYRAVGLPPFPSPLLLFLPSSSRVCATSISSSHATLSFLFVQLPMNPTEKSHRL
jgi:hypothetical protein